MPRPPKMAVERMRQMEERKQCACTGGRNELLRDALILALFMQIFTSSTAKKPKQKEYAVTVGINMKLCKKISTIT